MSILDHCEHVDTALRFYHNQPDYQLADGTLSIKYGVPPTKQLRCPEACIEIWPPSQDDRRNSPEYLAEYQEWRDNVMLKKKFYVNQNNCHKSTTLQGELDHDAELGRQAAAIACSTNYKSHVYDPPDFADRFTNCPYPDAQLDFVVRVEQARASPVTHPPWNVIIHRVDHGCGRNANTACLHGHFPDPGHPQCPWLVAQRFRSARLPTQETTLLASNDPKHRGGAVNSGLRNGRLESTNAALSYVTRRKKVMKELPVPFLRGVFSTRRPATLLTWHGGHLPARVEEVKEDAGEAKGKGKEAA